MDLDRDELIETVADVGHYFKVSTRNAELPITKRPGLNIRPGDRIRYSFDPDDETIAMQVVLLT